MSNKTYTLQDAANDALGVLAEVSDQLYVVKEFVDNTKDEDLAKAAQQAIDTIAILRLKLNNRSIQGKFRK